MYREREREIHISICVYIYIERERDHPSAHPPLPQRSLSWASICGHMSEAYERGRIKRGCSQKPDLQIGFKTGPRNMYR